MDKRIQTSGDDQTNNTVPFVDPLINKQEFLTALSNDPNTKSLPSFSILNTYNVINSPEVAVWSARVPIDANEENIDWEGGLILTFQEKLSWWILGFLKQEDRGKLGIFMEWKSFCIWSQRKEKDADPFLDDDLRSLIVDDHLVASVHSRRTDFNHAEVNIFCYPQKILQLLKKHFPYLQGMLN